MMTEPAKILDQAPTARDVTAIVCTWNAEDNIVECLKSIKSNGVEEIILVDATSSDWTRELAAPYVDQTLADPRKGLAIARNMGAAAASHPYVIYVGPDNIMPPGGVAGMLAYLLEGGHSGVSSLTITAGPGYWTWATDQYKRARFYPGPREVIGTPFLFPVNLLRETPFDDKMGFSDDADLCFRWRQLGHTFAISPVEVAEFGVTTVRAIWERYRMYGKSDFQFWNKYSSGWTVARKVRSLLHPLRGELITPFLRIPSWRRFAALPFLLIITAIRYVYWLKFSLMARDKS